MSDVHGAIGESHPSSGSVMHTLTVAAKSVHAFHEAERQQQEMQKHVVHDLMRCVAENHEIIMAQQAQLAANAEQISSMQMSLQAVAEGPGAAVPARLDSLEEEMRKLREMLGDGAPAGRDELKALRMKLESLQDENLKTKEELGRAWGHIMADEAAEDVVETAFDGKKSQPGSRPASREGGFAEGEEDEMYQNLLAKSRLVSDSQTNSRIKEGMATLGGAMSTKQAFTRWYNFTAEQLNERDDSEEAQRKRLEEVEARKRQAMQDLAEQERLALERIQNAGVGVPAPAPAPKRSASVVKSLFKKKAKAAGKLATMGKQQHAIHEDKLEEKVQRKLSQKRKEQQMMADVEWVMGELPKMVEELEAFKALVADQQAVQDEGIEKSEAACLRLEKAQDALKAEVSAAATAAAAAAAAAQTMQAALDRADVGGGGGGDPLLGGRVQTLEDAFEGAALPSLKEMVDTHAKKLAELFANKASKEDLTALDKRVRGQAGGFAEQLDKHAKEIRVEISDIQQGFEGRLEDVGSALGEKVDSLFMDELEKSLRKEIERLARAGGKAISQDALDARLAALRAAMEAEMRRDEADAKGAAAFKCLLCDRPLPPKEDWRTVQQRSRSHTPSMPHNHAEVVAHEEFGPHAGGVIPSPERYPTTQREWDASDEPEVVYRGGFPTVSRAPIHAMRSEDGSMIGLSGMSHSRKGVSPSPVGFCGMDSGGGGSATGGLFAPMASSWGQRGTHMSGQFNIKRSGELPGIEKGGKPRGPSPRPRTVDSSSVRTVGVT